MGTNFQSTYSFQPESTYNFQPFQSYNMIPLKPTNITDENNFNTKLKHPTLIDQIRMGSNSCHPSHNKLYHIFQLPLVGDYIHNFQLQSSYILKGVTDTMIQVDSICNYIESVSLTINDSVNVIAKVDGFTKTHLLDPQTLQTSDKYLLNLDFNTQPLLSKCIDSSNYQICVKFSQIPPIRYELIYDVMFTGDNTYSNDLKKEEFTIIYNSRHSNNRKRIELHFKSGQILFK